MFFHATNNKINNENNKERRKQGRFKVGQDSG